MARWIDKAALWLFAAAAALFAMLVLTGGNIFLSVLLAFLLVYLLRVLVRRIPERRWLRRGERMRFARRILRKWAIMEEKSALAEAKELIPGLFSPEEWPRVQLVQRLPDEEKLNAGQLLELWRRYKAEGDLLLFATCNVDAGAFSLAQELTEPSVRLTDANRAMALLVRSIRSIPDENEKKERRAPFSVRIALLSQSIRPVRTLLYLVIFASMYLTTRSVFYLSAAILLAGLLIFRLCCRNCSAV